MSEVSITTAAEKLAEWIKGSYLDTRSWLVSVGTAHDWNRDEDVVLVTVVKSKAPDEVWKLSEREQDSYKINVDFETEEEELAAVDESEELAVSEPEEETEVEVMAQYSSSEIVPDEEDQYVLGTVKAIYDFFDSLGARIEDPDKKQEEDEESSATLANGLSDLRTDEAFKAKRHKAAEVLAKFPPAKREILLEKIEARIDTLKVCLNGTIDIRYCVDQLKEVGQFLDDPEIEAKTVGAVATLELYNS
jgi:hypothetical protein